MLAFCNDGSLPALMQAAIDRSFQAASQAMDRLVRTGVLRQVGVGRRHRAFEASELTEAFTALERQLATPRRRHAMDFVLPSMNRCRNDYVDGLMGTRHVGPPDSAEAHAGINRWIALFAGACRRAVQDASRFEEQVRTLQSSWLERVGHLRREAGCMRRGRRRRLGERIGVRVVRDGYDAAHRGGILFIHGGFVVAAADRIGALTA